MSHRRSKNQMVEDDSEIPGSSQSQSLRQRVNYTSEDELSFFSQTQSQKSHGRRRPTKSLTQNSSRDYPDDLSQSQVSQSRLNKDLSEEELNRLMGHVVRYILVSDRSKLPILRQNIQKNILDGSKFYRAIMERTKATLKKLFGYQLLEIDPGKYIIVNDIENHIPHLSFSPSEKTRDLLLFLALSHIFMSDEICIEDSMWNFFRKLEIIDGDNFTHENFGDVQHFISVEFVKQRYLVRSKIEKSDPEKFQYQWGARAEHEVSKRSVLEFVSRVFRNRPIQSWATQYKIVGHNESKTNRP